MERKVKIKKGDQFIFGWFSILIGSALLWWVASSHFEARAYNRLTGAFATTWDAMWLDLGVRDSAKE